VNLLIAIFLPLLGAALLPALGKRLGPRTGWVAMAFALISFACVAALIPTAHEGRTFEWPWVPSLGLSLLFLADGLAVFFGLVVSGMGVMIMFYGAFYLDGHYRDHGRFYSYLLIFMSAMLGTVFAGHLLLLFIFWELTGIASFLLIGFNHEKTESRDGARMALLVTSLTGLLMLAGVVLLGQAAGTMNLPELLAHPPRDATGFLNVILLLVVLGAFGKSAQFPFHFWLPNAMAAPTPVSAYLHSATMVKLGVFLCGRLFPVFQQCDWWMPLLAIVAFGTMLLGAVLAFLAVDLKAILAYSTVSQLGFLIGYYGMGPAQGVDFDYLHILNHVFYKGSLFMVAGIVDHAVGTRDIREVGGLWQRAPLLGLIALVGCAAMAGLPGTTGFVSKEYLLKEVFGQFPAHEYLGWFALVCIVLTSLIKIAFSARLFHGVFFGPVTDVVKHHYHAPSFGMLVPPLLLAAASVLFGCYPQLLGQLLATFEVTGLHNRAHGELHLWHGITRELLTSTALVVAGLALYAFIYRWRANDHSIPRALRFDLAFQRGLERFSKFTKLLTRGLRSDAPLDYLPVILAFLTITVGGALARTLGPTLLDGAWGMPDLLRSLTAALIVLSVVAVIVLRGWITQLVCLSVAGFLISFYYVLYRAPDLALTQLLVETVTLILVLLLLSRFPRSAEEGEWSRPFSVARRGLNIVLSLAVGGLMFALVLVFTREEPAARVGEQILAQTLPLAAGANAVNTTLVDFRGLDTLGEIAVLLITTLGCLGLLMRRKRTREEYLSGPKGPAGFGIEHEDETEGKS
jgi:NADH:ubiquinone oxidoreductase subunit 5 (subunit L)/multisubunit Na+/H+ antiporter MnhA subunit